MQNLRLRAIRDADLPAVLALNNAAAPTIHPLNEEELRALRDMCNVAFAALNSQGAVIAFVLSLSDGQQYGSENYRWFTDRGGRFQYIDRVVVSHPARGTGVGRALYEAVFESARARGVSDVTTEVSVEPQSPGSMHFHEHMGFRKLGEQPIHDGRERVALLTRAVDGIL